jgi:hypothetical protein
MSTQSTSVWLRPVEAAVHLQISLPFLAKLRCYGGGPRFSKCGKAVLYNRADLDASARARTRRSTSDEGSETEKLAS